MDNTLKLIVLDWIPSQSKVIDFGCGDGALLKILSEQKSIIGYGVENDPDKINACIINGVSVIQQDIDAGIHNYKGMGFDVAVMASSIQCLRKPRDAMKNILKVANECVITLPNFGSLSIKLFSAFEKFLFIQYLTYLDFLNCKIKKHSQQFLQKINH